MLNYKKILTLLLVLVLMPVLTWAGGHHRSKDRSSSTTYRSTYDKDWNRTGYIKKDDDCTIIYGKDYNVKGYIKNGTIYDKNWERKGFVK